MHTRKCKKLNNLQQVRVRGHDSFFELSELCQQAYYIHIQFQKQDASLFCSIFDRGPLLLSFAIYRWHAVASWTWDAQDETCGICRMAFDGCCPDCKLPGDDCPLSKFLFSTTTNSINLFFFFLFFFVIFISPNFQIFPFC